jgi:methylmalonyl-CoA mutase
LILKNESYFDKVSNPSDGSYYVDYLTNALSEKALELFKSIEKSNGFIQQLFDGKIQEKIDQQFSKSLEQFKNKKLKLVGVNVFENEDDKMKEQLEKNIFPTKHKRKTLLKPITKRRIAEQLEQQRLSQENI